MKDERQQPMWECEVIRDLIPSYVDEVCSDRSREVVEAHMRECDACKKMVEQYRATDFSSGKLEAKEINGLKKIRRRMQHQRMISGVLALLLVILGVQAFWGNGFVPKLMYYVLMPLCMFGVYRTGEGIDGRESPQGVDRFLAAGAVVFAVVSVGVLCMAMSQALGGERVLGVAPEHAGPTLAGIWALCFAAQLALFAILWYRQSRLHVENRFRLCVCITGMFLLLVYVEALRNLNSIETVISSFVRMSSVILLFGLAGTLACYFLPRRKS